MRVYSSTWKIRCSVINAAPLYPHLSLTECSCSSSLSPTWPPTQRTITSPCSSSRSRRGSTRMVLVDAGPPEGGTTSGVLAKLPKTGVTKQTWWYPRRFMRTWRASRTKRTPKYYDPRRNPRKGEDFAAYHKRMRRLTTAGIKTTESQHYRDYLNLKLEVLDDMDHPYIGPCTAELATPEPAPQQAPGTEPAPDHEDNPMPVLMDSAAEAQVCKNIVNSILKQTGCRDIIAKADIAEAGPNTGHPRGCPHQHG